MKDFELLEAYFTLAKAEGVTPFDIILEITRALSAGKSPAGTAFFQSIAESDCPPSVLEFLIHLAKLEIASPPVP